MVFKEILTQAYRLAGVLTRAGRGLSNSDQEEGVHITNALLDGLKTERCFVYQVKRSLQPTVQNQQEYAVGAAPGADWVLEDRPAHIYEAGFIVNSAEIPMDVLREFRQWKSIVTKGVTAIQPRVLYYQALDPGINLGRAFLWPVPSAAGQIAIYVPTFLQEIADIESEIMMPANYRQFLEYQIAVQANDRHPEAKMRPQVEVRARQMKSHIMANQLTPLYIGSDLAALSRPRASLWYDARTWTGN